MASLTELSSKQHQSFKIAPSAHIDYAKKQHFVSITASELSAAASCFPVFASKNEKNGGWSLSAITSFELENNLFIENELWTAIFQPNSIRTYPLYLMRSDKDERQYTVGILEESDAFSSSEGTPLFKDDGTATDYLSEATRMLESQLANMKQTFEFGKVLEQMKLLRSVDVSVQYQDGKTNIIKGLYTIDENAFRALSADQLKDLNAVGYLTPIHAMMISLYQLNSILNKNNLRADKVKIVKVNLDNSDEGTEVKS